MEDSCRNILVINPGSTSTRVALFANTTPTADREIRHSGEALSRFERVWDQLEFRLQLVRDFLREALPREKSPDAVAGRGGLLRPVEGGVYAVNTLMLTDAERGYQGEHPANLGCALAHRMGTAGNCPAYIVDPVSTNELHPIARISGYPPVERRSLSHALSLHYVSRRAAADRGMDYHHSRFVVAHLGGGFSIAPVEGGRIIDVNDASNEGPFSPTRSGSVPPLSLVQQVLENDLDFGAARRVLLKESGWQGYLRTADGMEVEQRINGGDTDAEFIVEAMAYQVAKEIAAMSTVLHGQVAAVILTGGLANYQRLTDLITRRVSWIAPVEVYAGAWEMNALAEGAYRALTGEETVKVYG